MLRVRKRQVNYLVHIMRKMGLENMALAGYIEGKRTKDVSRPPTEGLAKRQTLLTAIRNRRL